MAITSVDSIKKGDVLIFHYNEDDTGILVIDFCKQHDGCFSRDGFKFIWLDDGCAGLFYTDQIEKYIADGELTRASDNDALVIKLKNSEKISKWL